MLQTKELPEKVTDVTDISSPSTMNPIAEVLPHSIANPVHSDDDMRSRLQSPTNIHLLQEQDTTCKTLSEELFTANLQASSLESCINTISHCLQGKEPPHLSNIHTLQTAGHESNLPSDRHTRRNEPPHHSNIHTLETTGLESNLDVFKPSDRHTPGNEPSHQSNIHTLQTTGLESNLDVFETLSTSDRHTTSLLSDKGNYQDCPIQTHSLGDKILPDTIASSNSIHNQKEPDIGSSLLLLANCATDDNSTTKYVSSVTRSHELAGPHPTVSFSNFTHYSAPGSRRFQSMEDESYGAILYPPVQSNLGSFLSSEATPHQIYTSTDMHSNTIQEPLYHQHQCPQDTSNTLLLRPARHSYTEYSCPIDEHGYSMELSKQTSDCFTSHSTTDLPASNVRLHFSQSDADKVTCQCCQLNPFHHLNS